MKFLIRDDDTCAFTKPEELERCYAGMWDHIPINLSVTPFRIPGTDAAVPRELVGCQIVMPLEKNKSLVGFLRKKIDEKKINIALHGYNHTKPNNLAEYIGETNLLEKTKVGKGYLEELLSCKIDTFVPPNNGIERKGIGALVANNLNLIGMPSMIRPTFRGLSPQGIVNYIKIKAFNQFQKCQYPFPVCIDGHKEVSYCSVTPSQTLSFIESTLSNCNKFDGVFILATHYHAFDKKLKSGEYIRDAIDHIIGQSKMYGDVKYCTYKQVWGDT